MKTSFKKNLLLIISIFTLLLVTNDVYALTITNGNHSKDSNTVIIPITLKIPEGENVKSIKIDCKTNNLDVTCEMHKKDNFKDVIYQDAFLKPVGTEYIKAGDYEAFDMVLTNNSKNEEKVSIELNSSVYETDTETLPLTFNTTVSVSPKNSSNPKAQDIHFSQGKMFPAFDPNTTEYTVYGIKDTINSVKGSYSCQEAGCTDSGWSGGKAISGSTITLNQGENKVSIELVSGDGTAKQTYTFTIIRGETSFNSSKLSDIKIGEYTLTPTFSKDVLEYSFTVPNKIDSIKNILKVTSEDSRANINIAGGETLNVGENIIKVTVDNLNNDESTTYTIKVNRLTLDNIEITNYKNNEITFLDSEGVKNTLKEDEFKVQYPSEYEKITNGTYKFNEDGERVTEDDSKKEEETPKKEEKKKNNTLLIVVLIVVGLIIIIVSGILIFKKKPKDKNHENDKVEDASTEESEETKEENETNAEDNSDKDLVDENTKEFENTKEIDEALSDLMSTKQYDLSDLTDKSED